MPWNSLSLLLLLHLQAKRSPTFISASTSHEKVWRDYAYAVALSTILQTRPVISFCRAIACTRLDSGCAAVEIGQVAKCTIAHTVDKASLVSL